MTTGLQDWAALGQPNRGDGDRIIYYRRPTKGTNGRPVEDPGWIVFGDSISGSKLRDFVARGFQPLMQYGTINSAQRDVRAFGSKSSPADPTMTREQYIWEGILSHPDGPAEFPLEQIIAFGWYRPEQCPVPTAYFPQLVGKKVKEYTCPERCGRKPFVEIDGVGGISALRQHLRIMHEWDQANLQAYGERVGIDFNKADVAELLINDMQFGSRPSVAPEPVAAIETVGEDIVELRKQQRLENLAKARAAKKAKVAV